jgi:hypothetical protein
MYGCVYDFLTIFRRNLLIHWHIYILFSSNKNIFFWFSWIFFCVHYDWISRMNDIIDTLCYQNNKGNNEWNSEKNSEKKKRKKKRERHIHINSFVTHTRWWEKKMQRESYLSSLLFYTQTHIHNFVSISIFFYSFVSIHEREKQTATYKCICVLRRIVLFCHSESGSMYLRVKRTHTHTHTHTRKKKIII